MPPPAVPGGSAVYEYVVFIAGEWAAPDLVFAESPEEAARVYCQFHAPTPGEQLLVWSEREYSLLPELRPAPRILCAE